MVALVAKVTRSNLFVLRILSAFLLVFFSDLRAQAQTAAPQPALAWEMSFSHSIDWYVRTSSGVLIVRAGKSLAAVDGQDGQQLWSFPEIEVAGGMDFTASRGNNFVEVPGLPIVIINRAKLPGSEKGELLGVNLWTGAIQWRQPELDDLISLIPLYDSKRILLCSKKVNKPLKSAIILSQAASPFVAGAGFLSLYYSGPYPFRPIFTQLDPLKGTIDWTSEYPKTLSPGFLDFRRLGGQLYLHEVGEQGGTLLAAFSLKTREKLWEFIGGSPLNASTPLPLQFVGGKVIFVSTFVAAFDPSSSKPVWQTQKLGKVFGVVADGGVIYGTSRHHAFALDAANGNFLWKTSIKPDPTNPVLMPEEKTLVLCDNKEFLALDATTGKVLHHAKTNLQENPLALRTEGKNYVLATHKMFSTLFELNGNRFSDEPLIEGEYPAASFLVSHPLPKNGARHAPDELLEQLRTNWDWLVENAGGEQGQKALARIRPFVEESEPRREMYIVSGDANARWHLWRIDFTTGTKQEFPTKSSRPEAAPDSGLIFEAHSATLRCLRVPSNPPGTASAQNQ